MSEYTVEDFMAADCALDQSGVLWFKNAGEWFETTRSDARCATRCEICNRDLSHTPIDNFCGPSCHIISEGG